MLTLPNQSNTPFLNPAGGHQRPPFEALKLLFLEVLRCDPRCIYKVNKIWYKTFGTAKVHKFF